MVLVRAAKRKDIPEILELLYELGRPKPKTTSEKSLFEKKIIQYLKEKNLAVAELDSEIVGMISMMLVPRLNHTKLELYIPDLVVSSKHRKSGIGKSLIDYCIGVAKKKNCFRIRLESGHARKESHKFYSRLGFDQYAKAFKLDLNQ